MQVYNNGGGTAFYAPPPVQGWSDTANWHHYAYVRNGNTFTAYTDGIAGTPITFTGSIDGGSGTISLYFGGYQGDNGGSGAFYQGYMDEIRVSKGVARYTANFPITGNDTITTSGGYTIHTFTGAGTLTVSGGSATCDILVVGGGGGASLGTSGGGGGGGYTYMTSQTLTSGSWNVTVTAN
jgi:hypothetical protein